jgi:hypothetical protein
MLWEGNACPAAWQCLPVCASESEASIKHIHLHPAWFSNCNWLLDPLQAGPARVLQAGVRGAGRHHHLCNACEPGSSQTWPASVVCSPNRCPALLHPDTPHNIHSLMQIFDGLAPWITHLAYLEGGHVLKGASS